VKRARPSSVFVPYERIAGIRVPVRTRDLPRFVESHQVLEFIRSRPDLASRLLEWTEETDTASIDEYMSGVGEDAALPPLIQLVQSRKH